VPISSPLEKVTFDEVLSKLSLRSFNELFESSIFSFNELSIFESKNSIFSLCSNNISYLWVLLYLVYASKIIMQTISKEKIVIGIILIKLIIIAYNKSGKYITNPIKICALVIR